MFFLNSNEINKPLGRQGKREEPNDQNQKYSEDDQNQKYTEDVTIWSKYTRTYANKSDNLDEKDKFLETCKLLKLT